MRLTSPGLCHNRDQYEKACQSSQSQRKGGTSQLGDEVQHHQRWCYPEDLSPVLHIYKGTGPAFPETDEKNPPFSPAGDLGGLLIRSAATFRQLPLVEVRGVEPRSAEPLALASPSAVVSELRTQEL